MSNARRYRLWGLSKVRRLFSMEAMMVPESPHLPKDWADPIIHSWGSTGNFGRMARDAIANARKEKRQDDVALYRAMIDQFGDFMGGGR